MPTLKRLREEAALSQIELGRVCGVSSHTIWRWEQALSRPSPEHRRKLSEIFGKTPKEVLEAIDTTAEQAKKQAAA
jgi:transcriptional regulator with XRE-family HTH domain